MLQCPSFDLYAEILLWALDDTGILYFSEDMLQNVFMVPTLSLHNRGLVLSAKDIICDILEISTRNFANDIFWIIIYIYIYTPGRSMYIVGKIRGLGWLTKSNP